MKNKRFLREDFWFKQTLSGGTSLRTRSKILFGLLPFLLAGLLYGLLIMTSGLENGPQIIRILAYAVIVLVIAMILLILIISLIEYLRKFE